VSNDQAQLLRVVYDQHAVALWAHIVRLTGDPVFAEDVLQETLLRAWRHPEVLDQSARSPRTWLFTVARHTW
jgi:RNA polymerase sigma-70 factor, ECF subfamily